MHSIWETAANTPWWVYALFIYLVRLGFLATQPRIIPVKNLLLLPTLFVLFSLFNLYSTVQVTALHLLVWLGALCLGCLLGWLQYAALKIKAIKDEAKLYIPGTWTLLFIILIIFSIKYYFNYESAIEPSALTNSSSPWVLLLYGLFTGLFIGRMSYAFRCLKYGPFVTESSLAS